MSQLVNGGVLIFSGHKRFFQKDVTLLREPSMTSEPIIREEPGADN